MVELEYVPEELLLRTDAGGKVWALPNYNFLLERIIRKHGPPRSYGVPSVRRG